MPAAQVVGTDILFGIVLAGTGSVFHVGLGSISGPLLKGLLLGGIPGVLLGCAFTSNVPSIKLKAVITVITLFLAVHLMWTRAEQINPAKATATAATTRTI